MDNPEKFPSAKQFLGHITHYRRSQYTPQQPTTHLSIFKIHRKYLRHRLVRKPIMVKNKILFFNPNLLMKNIRLKVVER